MNHNEKWRKAPESEEKKNISLQNIYFKMVNFINQIKLYFNR